MPIFQYPLKQHIGVPSVPTVAVNDLVSRGQQIERKPDGSTGANLHASVSGRVARITADYVEVEPDTDSPADTGYIPLSGETPLELVEASGLVGLGGAGYPTYLKLAPLPGGTVIMNAAECEPLLCHNAEMLSREPGKAMRGLHLAMQITGAAKGVVAVKPGHDEALAKLAPYLDGNIRLCTLPPFYPAGEERAVIREALGVLTAVNELPGSVGAAVFNAETLYRLAEAVDDRKPFMDKDLTLAGKLSGKPIQTLHNVPIGLPVQCLLDRAGGAQGAYGELIMGGPFTGRRITPEQPVIKTTGGILLAEEFPARRRKMGLLVCACGPDEKRLREIAQSMEGHVVGVAYCKQALQGRSGYKCENPGRCPGQAQKVLALKSAGAEEILIGNCSDCTNTVMACAPRLGLVVHHATDGALRAVNHKLIRNYASI